MATESKHQHLLTLDSINPNIQNMEHPIRGPLLTRIKELEKELKNDVKKPFKEIIKSLVADCHAMGQPPLTFIRQVMSVVIYPQLLDDMKFPDDAKQRAKTILDACNGGSIGSYTDTKGIAIIRKHVAEFIEKRDGIPCNWEDIILCTGASDGIRKVLRLFVKETNGKKAGLMFPVPQYPIFSILSHELGFHQIKYYLDEFQNWRINVEELQRSIDEAKKVCNPKVLVIINPGNPTGQILTRKNIEEIIQFAYKENLYILADEVYQHNIYSKNSKFYSFKKVMTEMGEPYSNMELASFMSCSKGYTSECGFRSGFSEIINMCPEVKTMFHKANSAMSCPPTTGQACMEVLVHPPEVGEPSYDLFIKEKEDILNSLKVQAKLIVETLNSFEGISCNELEGSMHLFPQIKFPPKVLEAAKKQNQSPDKLYASEALENAGICLVPGEALGQVSGTYHFRITLMPVDQMKIMLERLEAFHKEFMDRYR
ncbi:hypothetical protein ILUMI_06101 [Ignelater luminosus]|uniref:alanine transaminase n=1 Tax=Ignelater luminosus TaxID=2038154 RepID=A0A8K0D9X1_IGNLU|nr:hypothetical protein ILUMI_06101 [Ignelater luminosus]